MLYEVMKSLKCIPKFARKKYFDTYVIKNGSVNLPFVDGQYFLVEGSMFNDGVYQYPTTELKTESFEGCITALAIPKDFLQLVEDIEKYKRDNPETALVSESFGGYSYTKATDTSGNPASWQSVFSKRLNAWRMI